MEPVFDDDIEIGVITDADQIRQILDNDDLVKLVIRDAAKKPFFCRNWGDIKGEDHFEDVAIILTQDAMKLYPGRLNELPKSTLRKLYVACTRARRNLYLINPKSLPTNS